MNILPVEEIEKKIKSQTTSLSEVHGYGHLHRTAVGAQFFAHAFGESDENQEIAYIVGLIHDLERPNTEKIDHADISVREAKSFLNHFSINQDIKDKILHLIETHRQPQDIPLTEQWVYLSDKLFEQSGAYVLFRRSYYIGECEDFKNMSMEEAVKHHMNERMEKFKPNVFHEKVRKLADYQYQFQEELITRFVAKESWAWHLAETFYQHGRQKNPFLEKLIEQFNPITSDDRRIQNEARDYIQGKKYSFFESLLSK
ncbi:MAG: hypothetical protein NUV98_03640 [Candidatus Roizmanbacteria bacterium]|nr:hypothetical protein [Candidatus Roizmanbacteria bacterium]